MASICIPEEFLDGAEKIVNEAIGSIERVEKFTEFFGGNKKFAQEINALYEKKLLLKNQDDIIENFIDDINGISLEKKEKMKISIKERLADRKNQIMDEELLSIVKEISDKKYGVDLTPQQSQAINASNKLVSDLEEIGMKAPENSPERLAYGRAVADHQTLIDGIINPENNLGIGATIRNIIKESGQEFGKEQGILGNTAAAIKIAGEVLTSAVYKSVQASMDFSMALRQGLKVLANDPKLWKEQIVAAFKPFQNVASKKEQDLIMREFKARMVSSDWYKRAVDSGLDIGVIEEFFPTAMAEKIPILGNIFKASNEAFTIFSQGSRMGLFKDMAEHAASEGAELTPQLLKEFAIVANSISGRGSLGSLEASSGFINKIFYSGRFIKSQTDIFSLPFSSNLSPMAKQLALKSSVKTLGTIGMLMAAASLFTDVETDPRSSKFGKMKVPGSKDTWVDLTGGLGSYMVLASRIATMQSKSATTGKVTELNTGKFGAKTAKDVAVDFFTNKLAPAPAVGLSYLKGKDFSGKKPTLASSALQLAKPISAGNAYEIFQNEDLSSALIATMFDLLGAGQTDYSKFR